MKPLNARILSAVLLLGVTGCTVPQIQKLETPSGKHRRPINIHGTILPVVQTASTASEPVSVAPEPAPMMMFEPEEARAPANHAVPQINAQPAPQTNAATAAPRR